METKANYTLIGLFTLAVIAAGFVFVYWFHRAGGVGDRAVYRVVFDTPVSGLRTGAAVVFNGIRVGDVQALSLNPQNPRQVIATIGVGRETPVRADTLVGVEYQGLTGIASLSLRGGSGTAPPAAPANGDPPLLKASAGATQDVMQSGRDVLQRLDTILLENQVSLRETIKNLETFSAAMVRNSERIDRIVARTESLMTGADELVNGKDGKPGEVKATLESIKQLAENLDKRTADISVGLERFANTGLRQWERFAVDGRRAANQFERAVRNFQRNPSRVIWGGSLNENGAATQRRRR